MTGPPLPAQVAPQGPPLALRRGATTRARGLLLLALAALVVALATGTPALVVAAAVLIVPVLLPPGAREPATVTLVHRSDGAAVLTGESTVLEVGIRLDAPAEHLLARLSGPSGVLVEPAEATAAGTAELRFAVTLTPRRWGPLADPQLTVEAGSCRGLRGGRVTVTVPVSLLALPRPREVRSGAQLRGRVRTGDHTRRRPGGGTELHGLRPYQPGDRLRDVHWAASSRRDEPYVVERDVDAAIDVVLLVDVLAQTGSARAANAVGVEGAVSLARALCNGADRTGLIGLGATVAMTPPGTGLRHWYRLARSAAMLPSRESYATPDLARVPPAVLPRSAMVVVFTPLADPRIRSVLTDLRRRRYPVVVIHTAPVLPRPAAASRLEDLTVRLAALERTAIHTDLRRLGCRVLDWDGRGSFDPVLDRGGAGGIAMSASNALNRPAYALISLLLVGLPLAVDTGAGVRVVAALAAAALAAGYPVSSARVPAAGLSLAAVAVAAGHDHGPGALAAGGAAGVLVLLLLTLPVDREADGWTLRALAMELPVAVVAAVLAGLPLGRLPLLLGLAAAAGLVAATVPAGALRRRH